MAEPEPSPVEYGPYHRQQGQDLNELMRSSGSIGGKPARNIYGDSMGIPTVKAFAGPIPEGLEGLEFYTPIPPRSGSAPTRPLWYPDQPGVTQMDDPITGEAIALIPARITKVQ